QGVKSGAAGGIGSSGGEPVEQAELERRGEVEDVVPDRDAATRSAARRGEHAQRQVLDRKVGVLIGRGDPTAPRGGMGLVDHGLIFITLHLKNPACSALRALPALAA